MVSVISLHKKFYLDKIVKGLINCKWKNKRWKWSKLKAADFQTEWRKLRGKSQTMRN